MAYTNGNAHTVVPFLHAELRPSNSILAPNTDPLVTPTGSAPLPLSFSKVSRQLSLDDGNSLVHSTLPSVDGRGHGAVDTPGTVDPPPGLTRDREFETIRVEPAEKTSIVSSSADPYSIRGLPVLDELIREKHLPDDLLVYDYGNVSGGSVNPSIPTRYVRVRAELIDGSPDACLTLPLDHTHRSVAKLFLSAENAPGHTHRGHSSVFRAPFEVSLRPDIASVAVRTQVVAKLPSNQCGSHAQLHQEGRMYQAFPYDLMESCSADLPESERRRLVRECEREATKLARLEAVGQGKDRRTSEEKSNVKRKVKGALRAIARKVGGDRSNVESIGMDKADDGDEEQTKVVVARLAAQLLLHKVNIPATAPMFYGYYVPLAEDRIVGAHPPGTCDGCCKVDWPKPILLLENCGEPIEDVSRLTNEQKQECLMLLKFLHDSEFYHASPTANKFLIQPGPLALPAEARSLAHPSFRLIDFAAGNGADLCDKESFAKYFEDWCDYDYDCFWLSMGMGDD